MTDLKINNLVTMAKKKYPDLFDSSTNSIACGKGRHGESGYCNFLNKGTGYAYCLYAKKSKYYLSIWVSEATKTNLKKLERAAFFKQKFSETFSGTSDRKVKEKFEHHQIDIDRSSNVYEVDMSDMEDEVIVEYMAKLAS
jgi:hypothetical protein